mmetsp:Transcript_21637/g.69875  ORF Transcript_21637/g.69875 Transcript_21637/m.69875 type:complete len:201 (-) Transcript_21637:1124-1726(-)|eukprot:scaffold7977_cov128-Isochrysis_galbana.AAC.5
MRVQAVAGAEHECNEPREHQPPRLLVAACPLGRRLRGRSRLGVKGSGHGGSVAVMFAPHASSAVTATITHTPLASAATCRSEPASVLGACRTLGRMSTAATYMKPPAVKPSNKFASARPVASAMTVPSIAPTAVESCARMARHFGKPACINTATSHTSWGTSCARQATVALTPTSQLVKKAAPSIRPSVKLCAASAARFR